MSLKETEFRILRETIAARGTLRMALVPLTFAAWAVVAALFLALTEFPMAAVVSLAVLAAGFEAIHALHVGVERVGRYLQVYYEGDADGPSWETTAMRVGPGLPGAGVDPLFTALFVAATLANLIVAFAPPVPVTLDLLVITALHLAFIVRLVRARTAAGRQRAVDLERFRALRAAASPDPGSSV